MFSIRVLPEFTIWMDDLNDASIRGVIVARIKRLELGLMGDVQPIGGGISELRIHLGAGWRLYFTQRGYPNHCAVGGWFEEHAKKTSSVPRHWPRGLMEWRRHHE